LSKSILITSPYLSDIGGTEIEAISTAILFYDSGFFDSVSIFSPTITSRELYKSMVGTKNITCFSYPLFFESKPIQWVNRIFTIFGFHGNFVHYFYWFLIGFQFDNFFILTYPKSVYFFPIINLKRYGKKFIAKITIWHFMRIPEDHISLYEKFDRIIVFNDVQQQFWQNQNYLNNVTVLDIITPNEKELLRIEATRYNEKKTIVFGYLGRISKEKNIEDMLKLISHLTNIEKVDCEMMIQGSGDKFYIKELTELIQSLHIDHIVIWNKTFIHPTDTHHFFKLIDILLVTSKEEGGPITALEAAAAGRIPMGYNVGAMRQRFEQIPYLVNDDFKQLLSSVMSFLKMSIEDKNTFVLQIRELYQNHLGNSIKKNKLNDLFL
jgi:glycosyltransferase involved in cell wall biosynthesis